MLYWLSYDDNGTIYSVDMLRFEFVVNEKNFDVILKNYYQSSRCDVETFGMSTSPFKYRYLFKINYHYSSMICGIGFNGLTKSDYLKCFVEFNPNKVFQECEFDSCKAIDDFHFFIEYSMRFRLCRWDLAIDVPCKREHVQLVKDSRKYALTMHSKNDMTEYLGCRNQGGFVKVYNKTLESKLDTDVTRIELTCSRDMTIDDIMDRLPCVRILEYQMELVFGDNLSEKDKLLVDLLRLHPDSFERLNYRNRQKLSPYVFGDSREKVFNKYFIRKLSEKILMFEK